MALSEFRFFAPSIGKQVGAYVILPDVGKPPFATMYLLHGLSDDYSIWLRRTRIEQYVAGLPLAVVMPDGFRGFYTDANEGPPFARYMIEDVIGSVERHFRLKSSRDARCIGGLSMGGYGALRLGLGFPDLFASVNSHSGALMYGSRPINPRDPSRLNEYTRIFGQDPTGSGHDLLALAQRVQKAKKLPKLLIDCGKDDFLIDDNRAFTKKLKAMRVPHTYREFPGAHEWPYWDQHVQEAIAFHAKNLNLQKS